VSKIVGISIDCTNASALAHWWADTLGMAVRAYDEQDIAALRAQGIERVEDDPSVAVDDPAGGTSIWFNAVPEPKSGKNRIHLDVEADVDALVARGATIVERHEGWTVMADPEGNEFCAFAPSS
jgi:hypothetical protein